MASSLTKMGIFAVCGANGFIGSSLVNALLLRGYKVRLIVRSVDKLLEDVKNKAESIHVLTEVDEIVNYQKALDGVHILISCVGLASNDISATKAYEITINKLIKAFNKSTAVKLIHISSVAVYGKPLYEEVDINHPLNGASTYSIARINAERKILSEVSVSKSIDIVRVPMVIGELMRNDLFVRFYGYVSHGVFIHPGTVDAKLNCIGISKLVSILIILAESKSHQRNTLQFSDYLAWIDILNMYKKLTNKNILRVYCPPIIIKFLSLIVFRDKLNRASEVFSNKVKYVSSALPNTAKMLSKELTGIDAEKAILIIINNKKNEYF